jgi:hypothetical protein
MWQANHYLITDLKPELNILNAGLMLQAYFKLKYSNRDHWLSLIEVFLDLSSATHLLNQSQEDFLDQQILALSLNAISKFLKTEFKALQFGYLKETSEQCLRLFTNMGEGESFNKQSLMMNI